MNRLLEIGFESAGHWQISEEKLKSELHRHSTQANILYAFACDGNVMYVGKTLRTLSSRMSGYKNPGAKQSTNIKNHRLIRDHLSRGEAIEIFALPDNGLLHYGQFHLNLAAALEDDIIKKIDPAWNGGKVEQTPMAPPPASDLEPTSPSLFVETFAFTLQPTYYKRGFFNVVVAVQKYLGADGETIELFLGNDVKPTLGTINRRANKNATPRIMAGPSLRDWFETNARVGDQIAVQVFSPISIRLKVKVQWAVA